MMTQYPTLRHAFELIRLDSGAVNREEPTLARQWKRWLNDCSFSVRHLDMAEAQLAQLSKEALETVCAGEQDDAEFFIPADSQTSKILNDIFEPEALGADDEEG